MTCAEHGLGYEQMERTACKIREGNHSKWIVLFIVLIGIIVRVINFGRAPCGLNQDEAFAGYEAFSLLKYGVDSAGYHNPCYFVSWGSGMNVLESYLAIPFMKLFGCSVITLRLPQLILSCISLPVFYLLMKKIFSFQTALLGLGLLVISPWHIMLSRWGLESNLAPAFLLIGFYFFIQGIRNNKYLIFAAIVYGISLYSYSITWIVVPLTITVCGLYIVFTKQTPPYSYILIFAAILFVFALPLLLFLLVNKGIIPEIATSFFSIPKLVVMRDSEISIKNLFSAQSYANLLHILLNQNDGLLWNSTRQFGLFYQISFPFVLIGAAKMIFVTAKSIAKRTFAYEALIVFGMLSSVFTCLLIANLNVNKSNSLHFFTLILLTVGIKETFGILKSRFIAPAVILCSYALLFLFFSFFYFGSYNRQISGSFRYGVQGAVEYVNKQNYDSVCVDSSIYYSQILFFDQTPHDVFRTTVQYSNYPSAFLNVEQFGKYKFGIDYDHLEAGQVYIAKADQSDSFVRKNFQVVHFEEYIVAF